MDDCTGYIGLCHAGAYAGLHDAGIYAGYADNRNSKELVHCDPENRIQRRNVYEYKVKKEEKACNPYDKGARSMYLLIEKNLLIKQY